MIAHLNDLNVVDLMEITEKISDKYSARNKYLKLNIFEKSCKIVYVC